MNTDFSFPSMSQDSDLEQLSRAIRRINSPHPLPKVEVREFAGWRRFIHDRKGPEGRSVTHSISPFYDRRKTAFDPWAAETLIGKRGVGTTSYGRKSAFMKSIFWKWYTSHYGDVRSHEPIQAFDHIEEDEYRRRSV